MEIQIKEIEHEHQALKGTGDQEGRTEYLKKRPGDLLLRTRTDEKDQGKTGYDHFAYHKTKKGKEPQRSRRI